MSNMIQGFSAVARNTTAVVVIPAFLALSACQTSGNESLLSRALSSDNNQQNDRQDSTVSSVAGQNPNAATKLANTRNALTDYCPAVRVRAGTETLRDFPKGKDKENPDHVRYQATITKVARECAYVGQELQIRIGAKGRVITGPEGRAGSLTMPIRVAVTRGNDTIYSKLHRQQSTIASGSSGTNFSFVDDQVIIPAPSATNIRVFIGFDEGPYNTP